jgi:hypothetical protein
MSHGLAPEAATAIEIVTSDPEVMKHLSFGRDCEINISSKAANTDPKAVYAISIFHDAAMVKETPNGRS